MEAAIDGLRRLETALPPKFVAVSATFLLAYDNLLTLDREVLTIWKAQWSMGKLLFLLNRYVMLAIQIISLFATLQHGLSSQFCRPWYITETFSSIFALSVVQVILLLRTYALYKRSRVIMALLGSLCAFCVAAMTVLAAIFSPRVFFHSDPLPEILRITGLDKQGYQSVGMGCIEDCLTCGGLLQAFYAPMLLFEATVFCMTLASAIQHSRENVHAPFLTMLYRDGFIYFAVIFATSLSNLIMFTVVPGWGKKIMTSIIRALLSIMCSRLMLNIRETEGHHREAHEINSIALITYQLRELDEIAEPHTEPRMTPFTESTISTSPVGRSFTSQRTSYEPVEAGPSLSPMSARGHDWMRKPSNKDLRAYWMTPEYRTYRSTDVEAVEGEGSPITPHHDVHVNLMIGKDRTL